MAIATIPICLTAWYGATHIEQLRAWLTASPYDVLLALQADIVVS